MRAVGLARPDAVALSSLGIDALPLRRQSDRERAIATIDRSLRPLPAQRREAVLAELESRCGAAPAPASTMLRWSELAMLHEAGVEIGAHTVDHPVLSQCDEETARREIEGSIARVRECVGGPVTFAYPYGGDADVDERARRICRESGALAAVTLTEDCGLDDPFAIPRTMVTSDRSTNPWGGFSRAVWACELEGMLDLPRALLAASLGRASPQGRVA
jgi:peptidoglycan/xylan/chitin deacetylase (PgdA/CDA1 family)